MNIKALATIALAGGIAVSLSACGSSGTANTAASTNAGSQGGLGNASGGGFGGRLPGTSGLVAAVSGSTAQVQSTSAQTAVTWNSSTTFTDDVKVTKSAIKVGECVQAARARTAAGSTSTSPSSLLVAATVRIMNTSGGCTTVRQGADTAPSGVPSTLPGGPNGTRFRNLGGFAAIGVVTAASPSGFVVKPTAFGGSSSAPVTVTTSPGTVYTQTETATASAVKVGVCLSANGTTDSTGAVTAKRITLSQPTNGVCTQNRFGGRGLPGGGFPAGQGVPQNG